MHKCDVNICLSVNKNILQRNSSDQIFCCKNNLEQESLTAIFLGHEKGRNYFAHVIERNSFN